MASVSHVVPFHVFFEMSTNMLCCDQSYLFSHMLLLRHGVLIKSSNFISDHSYFVLFAYFLKWYDNGNSPLLIMYLNNVLSCCRAYTL